MNLKIIILGNGKARQKEEYMLNNSIYINSIKHQLPTVTESRTVVVCEGGSQVGKSSRERV